MSAENRDDWELLARLFGRISSFNREVEAACGLSLVQIRLLNHLIDNPSSTAIEVARGLELHPSTLTPLLRRLSARGEVFQTVDPLDARRKLLTVTKEGRERLARGLARVGELFGTGTRTRSALLLLDLQLSKLRAKFPGG